MNHGMLVTATARKEKPCKQCGEPIMAGVLYFGLSYLNVGENKRSFVIRLHKECIISFVEANREARDEASAEKRQTAGGRGGRPRATSSPEEAKSRMLLQHNVWKCKDRLVQAYYKEEEVRIKFYWLKLADRLEQYASIGAKKYKFGPELSKFLTGEFQDALIECNSDIEWEIRIIRGFWEDGEIVKVPVIDVWEEEKETVVKGEWE